MHSSFLMVPEAGPLILDQVIANSGFSTRRLKSNYSGSLIRVRRSSDNVEADIGFLPGSHLINKFALVSHVGAENLLTYSQDCTNATWTKQNTTVSVSATLAPDGTATAIQAVSPTTDAGASSLIQQIKNLSLSSTYVCSIFVKYVTGSNYFNIEFNDGLAYYSAQYNFSTITTSFSGGTPAAASSSMVAYPNGWYRLVLTVTTASSGSPYTGNFGLGYWGEHPINTTYLVWGAQINTGSIVRDYCKTLGSTSSNGSGYISKWYDQTGHGHDLPLTTTGLQIRVVDTGVVDTNAFTRNDDLIDLASPNSTTDNLIAAEKNAKFGSLAAIPAGTTTSTPGSVSSLPAVSSNSTISLNRGTVYQGTLTLTSLTNITINATGTGAAPVITPGQAITGFSLYSGNIYRAAIGFTPTQVMVDMSPLTISHWPSTPYVTGTSSSATTLSYSSLPNTDVVGARVIFRYAPWDVEARDVTAYDAPSHTMTIGANVDYEVYAGYTIPSTVDFFLEGKLWMLTGAGQWCVDSGYLYIWTPTGNSPEGRVWVNQGSTAGRGIDAEGSSNITIDGIKIVGAHTGMDFKNSSGVTIKNSEIVNCSKIGIMMGGSTNPTVMSTVITNCLHSAISTGSAGSGTTTVKNCRVTNIGTFKQTPDQQWAAINLASTDNSIVDNCIVNSVGYVGIQTGKNSYITNNTVSNWAQVLHDCGGIYTYSTDRTIAVNLVIKGNTVTSASNFNDNFGIYLDNKTNYVLAYNNKISNLNSTGFMIHDGHDNLCMFNSFSGMNYRAMMLDDDEGIGAMNGNIIKYNRFDTSNTIVTYDFYSSSGATAANNFATYDWNRYTSTASTFASFGGGEPTATINYSSWLSRMSGSDTNSTYTGV